MDSGNLLTKQPWHCKFKVLVCLQTEDQIINLQESLLSYLTVGWSEPSVRRTDHQPPQVFWSGPIGPSASTMSPRTCIHLSWFPPQTHTLAHSYTSKHTRLDFFPYTHTHAHTSTHARTHTHTQTHPHLTCIGASFRMSSASASNSLTSSGCWLARFCDSVGSWLKTMMEK